MAKTDGYLHIANWDTWQSYRRDRGQPPWIKVHRQLLRNVEWVELSDAQRGQLVAMWLLAADRDGAIPASPGLIQKLCFMTKPPDLQFFIDQGFIAGCLVDAKATPKRRQDVAPKAEEKAGQSRRCQSDADTASSRRQDEKGTGNGHDKQPVEHIFEHWKTIHEHPKAVLTPKRRRLILAALKDYDLDDLCRSIAGYKRSPHHMGENDRNTMYDSIELLLRDAYHIEAGLGFTEMPADGVRSQQEHRAEIESLAEIMEVSRGEREPWDVFEERVGMANRRRLAKITGNDEAESSSHKPNDRAARTHGE